MKISLYKKIIFSILCMLSAMLFTKHIDAQEIDIYSAADIFLETSPEIPGPNEVVDLTLNSYSFNLNNYFITWFEDGDKVLSGFGERRYRFTTGTNGTTTNITALIEVGSQIYRKEFRFTPSSLDLIWEVPHAYAPPFYKGKKLPVTQSVIRVTAIPETETIKPSDAKNLVYYWDNNYTSDPEASGFGKQFYEFQANGILPEETVGLTTNNRRESSFAKDSVVIPTNQDNILVLFYEINDNDRILTNKALNSFYEITTEPLRLSFHPLNISSIQENFTDLFVEWDINGTVNAPQNFAHQNELSLSSGGEGGSVSLSVTVENIRSLLQKSTETISLFFVE